jgi:hypothetical protein
MGVHKRGQNIVPNEGWKKTVPMEEQVLAMGQDDDMLDTSRIVELDLGGGAIGLYDVDELPLTEVEQQIVLRAQGIDREKVKYILGRRRDKLWTITQPDSAFHGWKQDLTTGEVYQEDGKTKYKWNMIGGYLIGKHEELHVLTELEWQYKHHRSTYNAYMEDKTRRQTIYKDEGRRVRPIYHVHHLKPWLKLTTRGNA